MKKLGFGIFVAALFSNSAFAVTGEKFMCTLTVRDALQNVVYQSDAEYDALRLESTSLPGLVDTRLKFTTKGDLKAHGLNYAAGYDFRFATKTLANGTIQAWQRTGCNVANLCKSSAELCLMRLCLADPFPSDPANDPRWKPTQFVNGVPAFLSSELTPLEDQHPNGETMSFSCQHIGTYP